MLVLCIGSATKLADRVQSLGKSYRTRILLGATSDTNDADGKVTASVAAAAPSLEAIRSMLPRFLGQVEQVPPAYSALKVQGQRAHALARRGAPVQLKPRMVRIDAIDLLDYAWPHLDLAIDCGKGTYIRSIARDLGKDLGVGGIVQALRRTRVGPFTVEQGLAITADAAIARSRLLPATILPEPL